ncbi:MAG: thioesterase [Chloroflexota bacterium]|nr:thioesterase [Chloroflexota bacterium]
MTAAEGELFRPPSEAERLGRLPFRVRFDEATPSGGIRTSVLLRYAADLASYHSEQRGFSRSWYRDRGLAWLVRGADLELRLPIRYGDELIGTTEAVAARKVLARRRTEFRTAADELAAVAVVDWALISDAGTPTRIPAGLGVAFGMADGGFVPVRVRIPAPIGPEPISLELGVRPQELDPMDHVNNAVYLDWAEEAIRSTGAHDGAAVDEVPRRWQLEYLAAAAPTTRVLVSAWTDPGGWSCRIVDQTNGQAFLGARLEA